MYINSDFFKLGSSAVDWCESNYKVVPYIAEFYNTITNAVFIVMPPIMIILFNQFGRVVTQGIHAIWVLLIIVGLGSIYFHSTLTMAGQLMDELSILWVIMISFAILFPDNYLPIFLRTNRNFFVGGSLVFTMIVTYLCFLEPKLNAYFLMLFAIPILSMLVVLVKNCQNQRVVRLAKRTITVFGIAVTFWICDRVFCDLWLRINMPYLHSVFHVLVYLSSYSTIVLFSYFSAMYKVPHLRPTLNYWPNNLDEHDYLYIPYVTFLYSTDNMEDFDKVEAQESLIKEQDQTLKFA